MNTQEVDVIVRQHRHIGAYGVLMVAERCLLIRKARGPYTGSLDLPGGGIAFGEAPEETLRREFIEETGVIIGTVSLLRAASHIARYITPDGVEEELHHLGLLYTVTRAGDQEAPLRATADGEDSLGALWVARADLSPDILSPFAALALLGV